VAKAAAKKRATERKPVVAPKPYVMPAREWDKLTELVRMFVATGWIANAKRQSMMVISDPGSGKTECLDRFNSNPQLQYASDLTVRGLYGILKRASTGSVTHIVATEFQKFFMRKAATADNTLGTLCQAIEEGVFEVHVGERALNFGGIQIGFIGAITHDTLHEKTRLLRETGFLSRVAVFPWQMTSEEIYGVMGSIGRADRSDLTPVRMQQPQSRITVAFPEQLSTQFQDYVHNTMRDYTPLRVFQRFRALAMACAVLDGRNYVHARDVEKVVSFECYWRLMLR
jgi:hypothetical protein